VAGASLTPDEPFRETRIGSHVRIGAGCRIPAGVTVSDGSVIPPNTLVESSIGNLHSDPELPLQERILEELPLVHVHHHWVAARGDQTLRVDYPLVSSDIVLDVGGYQGDWAEAIISRYAPVVHVFEPVFTFAQAIRQRLGGKIHLHPFGLAGNTREVFITLAQEGSSIIKGETDAKQERIQLVAARDVFMTLPSEIALMKINIEGAEYELLEHLLAESLLPRIRHLQIQFHDFVPDARARRQALRQALRATHVPTYNYPFIWEGWSRRGA
jgi:FkbM family methyltransferase